VSLGERLRDWNAERKLRYLGYAGQLRVLLSGRRPPYEEITLDALRQRRRTDTLFILGSGPSIRAVTPGQWAYVGRHDSFGINFSFLLDFVPTYHLMEDGKVAWHRALTRQVLAPRRGKLAPSVWFISNRHTRRLIHPRYTPELFPEPARVCVFHIGKSDRVLLGGDRPFRAADFARTVRYRGTMSLALDLTLQLGYTRIVLLGIDFQTRRHFFEDMEEMRAYLEHVPAEARAADRPFVMTEPRPGMPRPLDEYLYALDELHCRPRGIELFVGNRACTLAPRLPYFTAWDE
jgi:hypothetical protein